MKSRHLGAVVFIVLLAANLAACGDDGGGQHNHSAQDAGVSADAGDAQVDGGGDADAGGDPNACPTAALAADAAPVATTINGWTVSIDSATGAWAVTPPDGSAPVLRGPGSCARDANDGFMTPARLASGQAYVKDSFGNFQIELDSEKANLDWTPVRGVRPTVEPTDQGVAVRWPLPASVGPEATAELRFSAEGASNLGIALASSVDDLTTGEIAMDCQPDEAFFGLGSQVTGMNLRGRTFPLWTQEQGNGKPEDGGIYPLNNTPEAAYAPMGIWHSSAGYSAIIGHDDYSEIDLCETREDRVYLRSHRKLPKFVLVAGKTPKERLSALTEYTGRLDPAPPDWVFAPWFDAVGGPWRIDQVETVLRDNDIPASAIWTEDWIGGESTSTGYRLSYAWEWDPTMYPNLPDQIDGLHQDGFAFLSYFNPFVPQPTRMWDEGKQHGYLIQKEDGSVYTFMDPGFRRTSMVDLSNPDALNWFMDYEKTAASDLGIDGWMADYAEWMPVDAKLHSGQAGWEAHNRYPIAFQQANKRALAEAHANQSPSNDWTFFVRSGWASVNGGTAGTAPLMWGGDQNTNWKYDDGFPTTIPIGANLGMSGVAIYGPDIAGYNSLGTTNTDKELFYRWSAMGAFVPLMRTHHGGDECNNWSFDRDTETIAHYRRYASIHTLLFPYFKRLLAQAMDKGLPMVRHPYLVEPDRPALWTGKQYEFFLGDDLLVAPVLTQGATQRTVTLPEQDWWPLLGDAPVTGASAAEGNAVTTDVDAPVTEIPVFVRPGTALPLLSQVVDSFYGSNATGVSDLSSVDHELRLALYPTAQGDVTLAAHDGTSATGSGWTDTASLDWSTATLDGTTLPACASATDAQSCVDASARTVRLVGVTDSALAVGGATLQLTATQATKFIVGVAKDAWGEWAAPTDYSGLDPDAPSWCDGAPQ